MFIFLGERRRCLWTSPPDYCFQDQGLQTSARTASIGLRRTSWMELASQWRWTAWPRSVRKLRKSSGRWRFFAFRIRRWCTWCLLRPSGIVTSQYESQSSKLRTRCRPSLSCCQSHWCSQPSLIRTFISTHRARGTVGREWEWDLPCCLGHRPILHWGGKCLKRR